MVAFARASAPTVGAATGPLSAEAIRRTVWLTRPDLQRQFRDDIEGFGWWMEIVGRGEYRGHDEAGGDPADDFTAPAPGALPGVRPRLTRFMASVHRLRPDLRRRFDLATAAGQQGLAWWLLVDGAREHGAFERAALAACAGDGLLEALAEGAAEDPEPRMTRLMRLVWDMRPDLQAVFDIASAAGRRDLVWWCFLHGPAELGLDRYLTAAQLRFLGAPDPRLPQADVVPVSRLMARIWSSREDLQGAWPLDNAAGRMRYVGWFYAHGIAELGLLGLIDVGAAEVLAAPLVPGDRLSRILALLWLGDDRLRARFPDPRADAYAAWAGRDDAGETFPVLDRIRRLGPRPATRKVRAGRRGLMPGYNLIGYARGQLGIGEDVRMAALAMQAAGVPFSIYNIEPGREVCQGDDSAVAFVSDRLPYDTNLFCTTGIETARIAAVEGSRLFDGRRSIGYWPWELPEWPRAWRHAYDLVDEVWASSDYSRRAYARSSLKPPHHMPMAVTAQATAGLTRRDFRLPKRRFLFAFSFDALSGFARKNPLACVAAFREAFPRGDEPVGLVVKVMRARRGDADWEAFRAVAAGDRRIRMINRTLERGAVLDLYRACDCYVSLHRAEGFGRGIAEAMLLGKPVIVTGWSGNMDFTTPDTAALVEHRLVPVGEGDYPFAEGQLWADADVSHAAWWMRRMAEDELLRQRLSAAGRQFVSGRHLPAAAGRRYAGRLSSLAA
ncbi:MAG: glycosyltransferase [Thalassobaculum sp.]|uniref:glycosyltransferase n=1 Tax=Thalassobaculum sp. TaxID=2022740 RepID=UPI0032EE959D